MLSRLELSGFKSFAKPTRLEFPAAVSGVVGPNGSGKSNIAEAIRWVLGEQSIKSLRGKKGEDLIFNGSQTAPKLGKASVSLVLDNKKKVLPIDYDEVKITRKVFRDGVNDYLINDSIVRHKDVVELLSKIGLGTSSHHIISQGEADRILNASPKERRQMIEDALGLKIYQIRKMEAERKLEKTEDNINQVETLKKEIQPHLKFLKKQVEKTEEVFSLRDKLKNLYAVYFLNEENYLKISGKEIADKKNAIEKEFHEIKKELHGAPEDSRVVKLKNEIAGLKKEAGENETKAGELRLKRNSTERELGRIEGMLEAVEAEKRQDDNASVSLKEVKIFAEEIEASLDKEAPFEQIRKLIKDFLSRLGSKVFTSSPNLDDLKNKQKEILKSLGKIGEEEKGLTEKIYALKNEIMEKENQLHSLEKERYSMEARFRELEGILNNLNARKENFDMQNGELEREIREAKALLGDLEFSAPEAVAADWESERTKIRRDMERMKIRVEDSGAIDNEVIKEYEEVRKRDEFFEKELGDLSQAIKSLRELLTELEEKIGHDFKVGIEKINKEFQKFFDEMFGGGKAELKRVVPVKRKKEATLDEIEDRVPTLEDIGEEEEKEEGIEVYVNLPKKRIHSLDMLSGGERALTSIALLFAVSQVNPPPFLVLDETDAALDEANSQKYGKMLNNLSKQTQLIVITHNRETMKQADVLYGVTMSSDSVSKILSIKFTEAEKIVN